MAAMRRFIIALSSVAVLAVGPSRAADLPTLPTQAVDPGLQNLGWKGWTFGAGVSVAAGKGARGQFGGDTFAGYDHVFSNDLAMSVRLDGGYAPNLWSWAGARGFDYASLFAKATLNASSPIRPFFIGEGAVARGATFGSGDLLNPFSAVNGAFGGPGSSQKLGELGAGVAVDLSPAVHVEVGASVGNGAFWQSPF